MHNEPVGAAIIALAIPTDFGLLHGQQIPGPDAKMFWLDGSKDIWLTGDNLMSEHTVRAVLKRRSDDTQRVIRRRREHTVTQVAARRRSRWLLAVATLIVLIIIAVLAYSGWLVSQASSRFSADREAALSGANGPSLNLQSTTQFLPNTLLAAVDPNFYSNGLTGVSPVTAQLVRLYFPDAPAPAVDLMSVALQIRYSRTDILETLIDDVPMGIAGGRPVRGFAAASETYFQKPFVQLQPQDIALLVALAVNPGIGDPRQNAAKALALRNQVLQMDAQQGVLSQVQADAFKKTPLALASTEFAKLPSAH